MLAKISVFLTAWFLSSLIVGLLMGRAMSTFRRPPAPGFVPEVEDLEAVALTDLEDAEMLLLLAHAHMQ